MQLTGRQQLGVALAALRMKASVTSTDLAKELLVSQSKVSRVERGLAPASVDLVTRWLDAVDADDRTRARTLALADEAITDVAVRRVARSASKK